MLTARELRVYSQVWRLPRVAWRHSTRALSATCLTQPCPQRCCLVAAVAVERVLKMLLSGYFVVSHRAVPLNVYRPFDRPEVLAQCNVLSAHLSLGPPSTKYVGVAELTLASTAFYYAVPGQVAENFVTEQG